MSVSAKVSIEQDSASPEVALMLQRVTPNRMGAELGPRLTRLVQRNFRKLGTNKRGWPSTQFWARAAMATNWQQSEGAVEIACSQIGVRQRLLGGTIKPVTAKMLTIPATAEAYGKTAREFSGLEFKMLYDPASGKIRPALVERAGTITQFKRVKGKARIKEGTIEQGQDTKIIAQATGLAALFWLARSVKQQPNPRVMPSDEEFAAEIDKSMDVLLRRPTSN